MRRAILTPALVTLLAGACGLQAKGKGPREDDAGAPPPSLADGGAGDAEGDGGGALVDAGCSVVVDEPFAVLDPNLWLTTQDAENDDFPKVLSIGTENLLALVKQGEREARGGAWLRSAVPLAAFDLSFNFRTSCASCGDGFTVAWVSPATSVELTDAVDNKGLGLPRKLAGGAVAVDLFTNGDLGDTETPNVALLDLDSAQEPAAYRWVVTTSPKRLDLLNKPGGSTIAIRLRDRTVQVRVDGQVVLEGNVQTSLAEGMIGFTASTGSRVAGFFVKDLSATFYRCAVPDP